jgi:hypothetical protein
MNLSKESSLSLVELSILGVKDAYNELFRRLEDILRTCFRKTTCVFSYDLEADAYISFAWSWILERKKLHALYYRFGCEKLSESEFEHYLKNYYYSIARSAVFSFLKSEYPAFRSSGKMITDETTGERKALREYMEIPFSDEPEEGLQNVIPLLESPDLLKEYSPEKLVRDEFAEDLIKDLLTMLEKYESRKRISFWIVHLSRLFPLPDGDIDWLAALNGCDSKTIRNKIEQGIEENSGRMYAISSEFAGEILHDLPNTVTVRNKRLLRELGPRLKSLMEDSNA